MCLHPVRESSEFGSKTKGARKRKKLENRTRSEQLDKQERIAFLTPRFLFVLVCSIVLRQKYIYPRSNRILLQLAFKHEKILKQTLDVCTYVVYSVVSLRAAPILAFSIYTLIIYLQSVPEKLWFFSQYFACPPLAISGRFIVFTQYALSWN